MEEKSKSDSDQSKSAKKLKDPSLLRVLGLNKPEWFYILIGCLAGVVSGAANPAFSIIFS